MDVKLAYYDQYDDTNPTCLHLPFIPLFPHIENIVYNSHQTMQCLPLCRQHSWFMRGTTAADCSAVAYNIQTNVQCTSKAEHVCSTPICIYSNAMLWENKIFKKKCWCFFYKKEKVNSARQGMSKLWAPIQIYEYHKV